ncbi:hypothetical protein GCM10025857_27770 [Alicyclobacillus contaminans]|uniref:DinB family protein n=1 Tax=Alicyclobacillus contaminans TaxID=392016 RepID=UPI0003F6A495|nr:DinB family protein [Alicyclobacillus contaminans]GMA51420.1 hypothetical protein GCM10025857_27770 [Alicyclobacillus contaminans]
MYSNIEEFIREWNQEAGTTQKVLDALTDASLQQQVSPDDRTLGRIAWHIVTSIPGMLTAFGLRAEPVAGADTVPTSAKRIADTFRQVSTAATEVVRQQWTNASLTEIRHVFGMDLSGAALLSLLIKHMIHHRGQMTVLMRQAGVKVPGVYGPAREEWESRGMKSPTV